MIGIYVWLKSSNVFSAPKIEGGGRWKKLIWLVVREEFRK